MIDLLYKNNVQRNPSVFSVSHRQCIELRRSYLTFSIDIMTVNRKSIDINEEGNEKKPPHSFHIIVCIFFLEFRNMRDVSE